MDAEMKYDMSDPEHIAALSDMMLNSISHVVGIEPAKYRFGLEDQDRDALVAAISERIAEVDGRTEDVKPT
jgi:hypothetical protein